MDQDPLHLVEHMLPPAGVGVALMALLGAIPAIIGSAAGLAAFIYYCTVLWHLFAATAFWAEWSAVRRRKRLTALRKKQATLDAEIHRLTGPGL